MWHRLCRYSAIGRSPIFSATGSCSAYIVAVRRGQREKRGDLHRYHDYNECDEQRISREAAWTGNAMANCLDCDNSLERSRKRVRSIT
jgi:hypothetical protein